MTSKVILPQNQRADHRMADKHGQCIAKEDEDDLLDLPEFKDAPSANDHHYHQRKKTRLNQSISGMEGNGYYNQNSSTQEACNELGYSLFKDATKKILSQVQSKEVIRIADYGSSQGRNSMYAMKQAIQEIPFEHQIFVAHVDLPTNDFNSLFQLFSDPSEDYIHNQVASAHKKENVFVVGIGRSFYEQVLPRGSVHLGWSAVATHWLSDRPPALDHLCPTLSSLPQRALWEKQARDDWVRFLEKRHEEIIPGGYFVQVGIAQDERSNAFFGTLLLLMERLFRETLGSDIASQLSLPVYRRSKEEWLEPFGDRRSGWKVDYAKEAYVKDPLWAQYQKSNDAEAYADGLIGIVNGAMMPAILDGRKVDLRDFYRLLKKEIASNPNKYRQEWCMIIMRLQRL